jgi:hypothetical protein
MSPLLRIISIVIISKFIIRIVIMSLIYLGTSLNFKTKVVNFLQSSAEDEETSHSDELSWSGVTRVTKIQEVKVGILETYYDYLTIRNLSTKTSFTIRSPRFRYDRKMIVKRFLNTTPSLLKVNNLQGILKGEISLYH